LSLARGSSAIALETIFDASEIVGGGIGLGVGWELAFGLFLLPGGLPGLLGAAFVVFVFLVVFLMGGGASGIAGTSRSIETP
jgi:hypothetical protein